MYSLNLNYIDGVELDVRITKDNKIIIFHNPFVKNKLINHQTLKQIKKINIGTKQKPQKISTLNEFLKNIKTNKIILIEIKNITKNYKICTELLKIISKYKLNIYICSFNEDLIKYINYHKKAIIVGYGQNIKKLYHNYDFNMVSILYKDVIKNQKETFIFTINNYKKLQANIITDYPSAFKNQSSKLIQK